jgi:hypothetical protein
MKEEATKKVMLVLITTLILAAITLSTVQLDTLIFRSSAESKARTTDSTFIKTDSTKVDIISTVK